MGKKFILVHQISKKGRNDLPHLIAVDQIISLVEIGGVVYLQTGRALNGRVRIGFPVRERFEELRAALCSS